MGRIIGKGTTLGTGATSTTTPIAGITDVTQPKQKVASVDATEYTDPADMMVPGWLNWGAVTFKLNYTTAVAAQLVALLGVQNQYWKVTFLDGSNWTFQGWLSDLGGAAPIKGVVTSDAAIVITSTPVNAAS